MAAKATAESKELESSLQNLSMKEKEKGKGKDSSKDVSKLITTTTTPPKPKPKKKAKAPIADSWEDEVESSSEDEKILDKNDNDSNTPISPTVISEGIREPPPTPISPQTQTSSRPWTNTDNIPPYSSAYGSPSPSRPSSYSSGRSLDPDRRPEKQTAVAGRLIAGALGIRAPKRTEEQRAYDRSVKEQEIRRRNREKEEEAKAREAEERAKAAIWEE